MTALRKHDGSCMLERIASDCTAHLLTVNDKFTKYFPRNGVLYNNKRIIDPFNMDDFKPANTDLKEMWPELHNDSSLCLSFGRRNRFSFWVQAYKMERYSKLASEALKILLSFQSTNLCEKTFSSMAKSFSKNKYRSRIDDIPNASLRIAMLTLNPCFEKIAESIQQQRSH